MKKVVSFNVFVKVILIVLLLSNFSAFTQKTNIWIVRDAESSAPAPGTNNAPGLSAEGQQRAQDLLKVLKREKLQAIYIPAGKVAEQTAAPLAQKIKILPRIYADSINAFITKLTRNFQGGNVLIVAQYKDIMPIIAALGVTPPFQQLNNDDYDLLFSVAINESDKREVFITNYGKKHHVTEIPQEYIIQKFYPSFVPPMNSH